MLLLYKPLTQPSPKLWLLESPSDGGCSWNITYRIISLVQMHWLVLLCETETVTNKQVLTTHFAVLKDYLQMWLNYLQQPTKSLLKTSPCILFSNESFICSCLCRLKKSWRLMEGHAIQTAGVAETEALCARQPCYWKSPISSCQSWELG